MLVPAKSRINPDRDWKPASRPAGQEAGREAEPARDETAPGIVPAFTRPEHDGPPRFDEARAQHWEPALPQYEQEPGQGEQQEDKDEGGNVVWTFVSGAFSLGIGLLGVVNGDGFSVWSLLLIGVGATAIINGLRKLGKGSGG